MAVKFNIFIGLEVDFLLSILLATFTGGKFIDFFPILTLLCQMQSSSYPPLNRGS